MLWITTQKPSDCSNKCTHTHTHTLSAPSDTSDSKASVRSCKRLLNVPLKRPSWTRPRLMPAEKRPFEQDEAGAALEPAERPRPGVLSGEVNPPGESLPVGESLSPQCRGPALCLRSLCLIARVAHAKQKASMLHSACSAHSRAS